MMTCHTSNEIANQVKLWRDSAGRAAARVSDAESFMGFRHGPLAVVNERTLLVYFVSNDAYVFNYEKDLTESVRSKNLGCRTIAVAQAKREETVNLCDLVIPISRDVGILPDLVRPPVDVIFGQLLGLFKCISLGLDPDEPSRERGAISRLVEGVRLYPYRPA